MLPALLIITSLICAFQTLRASRLLVAALWLAGTSALLATLFFMLGAPFVAVIELSVGAGLVTVLFVFAIAIAGDEALRAPPIPPTPLAAGLTLLTVVLIAWLVLPATSQETTTAGISVSQMFWDVRGLDALVQVVLIFAGVLGILGLLTKEPTSVSADLQQQTSREASRSVSPQESDVRRVETPTLSTAIHAQSPNGSKETTR